MNAKEFEQKRFAIQSGLEFQHEQLEHLINATPSGPYRNELTDANIHLMAAIEKVKL